MERLVKLVQFLVINSILIHAMEHNEFVGSGIGINNLRSVLPNGELPEPHPVPHVNPHEIPNVVPQLNPNVVPEVNPEVVPQVVIGPNADPAIEVILPSAPTGEIGPTEPIIIPERIPPLISPIVSPNSESDVTETNEIGVTVTQEPNEIGVTVTQEPTVETVAVNEETGEIGGVPEISVGVPGEGSNILLLKDSEGRDVAFEILGNKGEKTSKDDTVTLLYGTLTYQFQDSNEDLTGPMPAVLLHDKSTGEVVITAGRSDDAEPGDAPADLDTAEEIIESKEDTEPMEKEFTTPQPTIPQFTTPRGTTPSVTVCMGAEGGPVEIEDICEDNPFDPVMKRKTRKTLYTDELMRDVIFGPDAKWMKMPSILLTLWPNSNSTDQPFSYMKEYVNKDRVVKVLNMELVDLCKLTGDYYAFKIARGTTNIPFIVSKQAGDEIISLANATPIKGSGAIASSGYMDRGDVQVPIEIFGTTAASSNFRGPSTTAASSNSRGLGMGGPGTGAASSNSRGFSTTAASSNSRGLGTVGPGTGTRPFVGTDRVFYAAEVGVDEVDSGALEFIKKYIEINDAITKSKPSAPVAPNEPINTDETTITTGPSNTVPKASAESASEATNAKSAAEAATVDHSKSGARPKVPTRPKTLTIPKTLSEPTPGRSASTPGPSASTAGPSASTGTEPMSTESTQATGVSVGTEVSERTGVSVESEKSSRGVGIMLGEFSEEDTETEQNS
ncbi:hypothetical protein TpMuguga_03g00299 [Theileria parva strain Muguga]|uniref:uncharacterized protein n=1 Tax=Theileria parva strain Muguga TaxID=333668 RepID=UPI001C61EBBB|nr:uncharacterized protein TpMuguga_03g00299 [Theileria parva strain Muguga]EAN31034.2 hypothetical protein TpMuguga_03g00299 [Theileria parva strain Muguga]